MGEAVRRVVVGGLGVYGALYADAEIGAYFVDEDVGGVECTAEFNYLMRFLCLFLFNFVLD